MAEPEEKKVWIACRAKESCTGNYAVITMQRNQTCSPGMGQFNASAGGRVVRYQCCTCHGTFTISS